tara:strand:- start:119 stop:418 length:300 start_codon:yes stop_codon:yes gene_type:complete
MAWKIHLARRIKIHINRIRRIIWNHWTVSLRNGRLVKRVLGITGSIGLYGIVVSVFQSSIQNQMHMVGCIIRKGMGDINNHDYYKHYFIYKQSENEEKE